jgi:hypothetical protein
MDIEQLTRIEKCLYDELSPAGRLLLEIYVQQMTARSDLVSLRSVPVEHASVNVEHKNGQPEYRCESPVVIHSVEKTEKPKRVKGETLEQ